VRRPAARTPNTETPATILHSLPRFPQSFGSSPPPLAVNPVLAWRCDLSIRGRKRRRGGRCSHGGVVEAGLAQPRPRTSRALAVEAFGGSKGRSRSRFVGCTQRVLRRRPFSARSFRNASSTARLLRPAKRQLSSAITRRLRRSVVMRDARGGRSNSARRGSERLRARRRNAV